MVDLTSIAVVTNSLNAAVSIGKSAMGLRDAETMRAKVIEMQGEISSALGGAVSAQMQQLELIESVRKLQAKIADLEAWSAEKEKYQLHEWPTGNFSYRLKESVQPSRIPHHLCTNCYNQGISSILQRDDELHNMRLGCPRCKTIIKIGSKPIGPNPFVGRVVRG